MIETYNVGWVEPWWNDEYKNLDYVYYPLKNVHDEKRWIEEGYGGLILNGGLYNTVSGPMPAGSEKFLTLMDWDYPNLAYYKMQTCNALPMHTDSYPTFMKIFNIDDITRVARCIVFLEDWKSGHYFEINNKLLMPWKAGDYVYWNGEVPHFAGNFGLEPRYTMQITGVIPE